MRPTKNLNDSKTGCMLLSLLDPFMTAADAKKEIELRGFDISKPYTLKKRGQQMLIIQTIVDPVTYRKE